ncbi:DUF2264 domain-containing protein [Burkholderiaceae bacterium FT117]|uniref:DUF2264 domain-containing protein n=1 Tax=Zeimonas sediminis TaxID=2944268 RepID=UPI002343155D|nr:DUF2264 domain-containing protein [Zeimonas sediminis]MCM5571731.1 DUF2264 domain-containing protein [Zeimonas sediminis]
MKQRSRSAWTLVAWVALGLAALAAAAAVLLLPLRTGVEGWNERAVARPNTVTTDALVRGLFPRSGPAPGPQAYDSLARYFLEGWASYRTPGSERAYYPGEPSFSGRLADGVEGFSRVFPLAAAWLASGRPATIDTASGTLDLAKAFSEGLANGTDPDGHAYWGAIGDYSPQLVESADVALGLWLSRESVWSRLDAATKQRVIEWLRGALESQTYDGNWQMFPMVVHRVLKGLGIDVSRWDARIESNWEYFKSSHRGEGWFFEPHRGFDYYNAWSVHYSLFWLNRIDPTFEPDFLRSAQHDFVRFYSHLFGPQGQPLMGRSVCYRMAAPAPLLTSLALAPGAISRGQAMRALDLTWSVFISRGALADGNVTQGFCGPDLSTLAQYSGPASCLWSLRSLVVAFALDRELGLFAAEREPLPVERGDFRLTNDAIGWTVSGTRETGRIELVIEGNAAGDGPALVPYGLRHRLKEWLLHAPRRPDNGAALYGRRSYSTDRPLVECPGAVAQ